VISIITNISMEHRQYLGNSLADITREKAGVIKNHTPVVTAARQQKAVAVIRQVAGARKAPLYRLGESFKVRRRYAGDFSYFGIANNWLNLRTRLDGDFQVENSALALAGIELLNYKHTSVRQQDIQKGLANVQWPGRLETFSTKPTILLDGAHNLTAARGLARHLSAVFADRKITLVIGILDDKPYGAMLKCLLPVCQRAILTRAQTDRALAPQKLFAQAEHLLTDLEIIPDVRHALRRVLGEARPEDVICIAGSLYVVGEARAVLERDIRSIRHHPAAKALSP
jgi:dihydrofolate synthase/folylpolyglutamate synthase